MPENRSVWNSNDQELKKKHSFRMVGGVETGSWGGEDAARRGLEDWGRQGGGWQSGWSYICVRINQEEQVGCETDHFTQSPSMGK